jgi:hypothetical protein
MARCEPARKKNPWLEPTSPEVPDCAPPSCVTDHTIVAQFIAICSGGIGVVRIAHIRCKSKYSVNPHPTSETKAFSSQSWYKGGHGKDPATRHSPLCACTGPGEGCDTLCPTERGADDTGLERAHLAGALLAGAVRAAGGAGNSAAGSSRSLSGHEPRPHAASVRDEQRKSDAPRYG